MQIAVYVRVSTPVLATGAIREHRSSSMVSLGCSPVVMVEPTKDWKGDNFSDLASCLT